MDAVNSNSFAEGHFKGVTIVTNYMKDQWGLLDTVFEKPETDERDQCMKALFLRAHAWMKSLTKLNQPSDVQAISTATRTLLETAVDMILLHHDKSNEGGLKMYWWGMSERIRSAEILVDFHRRRNQSVPDAYKPLEDFYNNEKQIVDDKRLNLWPGRKKPLEHPRRWTGNNDLSADVKEADKLFGKTAAADLGMTLKEFYRTEYRRINWYVHSGVAGVWNISPSGFHIFCGLAFYWCANLAMLCTKIILSDFGFVDHLPGLKQEWDRIKLDRDRNYLATAHTQSDPS